MIFFVKLKVGLFTNTWHMHFTANNLNSCQKKKTCKLPLRYQGSIETSKIKLGETVKESVLSITSLDILLSTIGW